MGFHERVTNIIWLGFLYSGTAILLVAGFHIIMIAAMSQVEFLGWVEGVMTWWLLPFLVLGAFWDWVQGVRLSLLYDQRKAGGIRMWRSFMLQIFAASAIYYLFI